MKLSRNSQARLLKYTLESVNWLCEFFVWKAEGWNVPGLVLQPPWWVCELTFRQFEAPNWTKYHDISNIIQLSSVFETSGQRSDVSVKINYVWHCMTQCESTRMNQAEPACCRGHEVMRITKWYNWQIGNSSNVHLWQHMTTMIKVYTMHIYNHI